LQRLEALSSLLARAAQLLGLLVGVGLLTALGNTIRLAVEERRDEIRVSKLIGASDAYVARPFLYTGTFLGLAGGLLAALLLLIVVAVLTSTAQTLFALYGSSATLPPFATLGLALTPLGGALGWTSAFVASRRAISRCEP
jgi:cell division transport system permease protein